MGKPGVCVGRLLGLGGWGVEGWEGLRRPMVVSLFLRIRLLSSWSSCSSRDKCSWELFFEVGPRGSSGGISSGPRVPALERRG